LLEDCVDSNFVIADIKPLCNVFTFCSDDGLRQSWIDHFMCSSVLNERILTACTLPQFISSDHKPLMVTFKDLSVNVISGSPAAQTTCSHTPTPDWSKVDDYSLLRFETMLNDLLNEVNITVSLLGSDYAKVGLSETQARLMVDNYYQAVTTCIKHAVQMNIPHSVKGGHYNQHVVAGWNDVVKDKHDVARAAFLDWVEDGKPRQGPLFFLMNRTRAAFKLAMRYCKQHETMIRADNLANSITDRVALAFLILGILLPCHACRRLWYILATNKEDGI